MILTAQQLYSEQVQYLPLAERFRLAALLLDDLQALPSLPPMPTERAPRPRPVFGSGKNDISYMADDFDAPLEDMREYSE
ncbi:MAG: type II toxin-antitoxin system prevent-host-death family antitoxin [Armatimonadetes bacterium]|nr:type II toxin-antitoxin system prevent-host-death family antitoxin [Armatimonadota bacterium]